MKYPINNPALFQLIFERYLDDINLRDDEKAIEDVTEDDCKNNR